MTKAERKRAWKIANPEKWKAQKKRYRKRHPEKRAVEKKRYYERHPEKSSAHRRRHYLRNREKVIHRSLEWKAQHPQEVRLYKASYTQELKDGYIRSLLSDRSYLRAKDIPDSLVELKRAQLRIARQLKESRNK